ncbi:MAG: hypothetical protein ACKV2T_07690 [Kofleriaceae bacterium]
MKSSTDRVIDGDLAALGDASRQNLPALTTSLDSTAVHAPRAPHTHASRAPAPTPNASAYRDDLPGAVARRDSLADTRRRELALMPLTLSQIYAHRVGRAAGGAAAILCALGLLVVLDDRFLVRLTAYFIPGFAIGMYALLSIAFVLVTYMTAHWIAEHRFTTRMRELVSKGTDAYRDLDQLAVGPFAVAAEKVRRVDTLSLALPIIGIAMLAPLLAYVGYVGALSFTLTYRTSTIDAFIRMTDDTGPVLVALLGGAFLAGLVAHAIRHEQRDGTPVPWVRWIGHWTTLIVAFVLGVLVLAGAALAAFNLQHTYSPPQEGARYLLAIGGEAAILLPSIWFFLWWRRRERWRLGD